MSKKSEADKQAVKKIAKEVGKDIEGQVRDLIMENERAMRPVRTYHPHTLAEVKEAVESGYFVMDDSIEVNVKDDWHKFPEGMLPCQKVTITFDFIRLLTDKGEIPFDKELICNGY